MEVSNAYGACFSETKSFPGHYKSLERIGEFVRSVAQAAGFDKLSVYSIEMAVDEACSNIIEHAYHGEGRGEIQCTCQVTPKAFTIVLRDNGKSFDPSKIPQPNLSKNIEERQAHGLGLFFIRKWMDEVTWVSNGSENTLTMIKRR